MKQLIASKILEALKQLDAVTGDNLVQIDRTRDKSHGDYACNIALVLARQLKMKPRDLAQQIVDALPDDPSIARVEIAGPGFINF